MGKVSELALLNIGCSGFVGSSLERLRCRGEGSVMLARLSIALCCLRETAMAYCLALMQ